MDDIETIPADFNPVRWTKRILGNKKTYYLCVDGNSLQTVGYETFGAPATAVSAYPYAGVGWENPASEYAEDPVVRGLRLRQIRISVPIIAEIGNEGDPDFLRITFLPNRYPRIASSENDVLQMRDRWLRYVRVMALTNFDRVTCRAIIDEFTGINNVPELGELKLALHFMTCAKGDYIEALILMKRFKEAGREANDLLPLDFEWLSNQQLSAGRWQKVLVKATEMIRIIGSMHHTP